MANNGNGLKTSAKRSSIELKEEGHMMNKSFERIKVIHQLV